MPAITSTTATAPADRKPVALTMGDACGIGPEIIAKAFRLGALPGAFVVGDVGVMRRAAQITGDGVADALPVIEIEAPDEAWRVPPHALPVLQAQGLPADLLAAPLGQVDQRAGIAAAECIRQAAALAQSGAVTTIVTAPIHKEALAAAGEPYPGHTELLQALAGGAPVRMMLANDELKTVLVTIHVSLRRAIEGVDFDNVLATILIAHQSARQWGQAKPRIGVAGLNPHAGEGGLFGDEELRIIGPAIAAAQAEGIDARGPFAPDTVFMRARHSPDHPGEFDIVVAMYHDQGLIPVKYLGVERGVNVTLGLPFIRTSPDHGTAFDLAGTGRADPASLIAAFDMALRLARPAWP
jgi:4-hydroxythreonine-4-phosphate dehydrogenase